MPIPQEQYAIPHGYKQTYAVTQTVNLAGDYSKTIVDYHDDRGTIIVREIFDTKDGYIREQGEVNQETKEFEGKYCSFYPNGMIDCRGVKIRGGDFDAVNADLEMFSQEGILRGRITHKDGLTIDEDFYEDGSLWKRITVTDATGEVDAVSHWKNGNIREKFTTYEGASELLDSNEKLPFKTYESYRENGRLHTKYAQNREGHYEGLVISTTSKGGFFESYVSSYSVGDGQGNVTPLSKDLVGKLEKQKKKLDKDKTKTDADVLLQLFQENYTANTITQPKVEEPTVK